MRQLLVSALLLGLSLGVSLADPLPEPDTARPGGVTTTLSTLPGMSMAPSSGHRSAAQPRLSKLDVRSNSVVVMDATDASVLYSRHATRAVPIASITKLMTALVVLESEQPLDEQVEITAPDCRLEKSSVSRLPLGTRLSRGDLLRLALMSSENRAAQALGRSYTGGLPAFIRAMNAKAEALEMHSARFADPTGLSSRNVSNARDLAKLVAAAARNPQIREFSTAGSHAVPVGKQLLEFRNTNGLVARPDWNILVQKTGFTNDAGQCLVMQAVIDERPVTMVLLNSFGKYTRVADARRIRRWMEANARTIQLARTEAP